MREHPEARPHQAAGPTEELRPLHAHQITPDDAMMLRMLSGARFDDETKVTLPSGVTISGAEMRRWTEEQS